MSEEFQRLSEGYDFIEEACGYSEPLTFTETEDTVIVESENRNSTFKILGRCSGQFQPCGEFSRNQRLYEQDHWNHILENVQFQDRIKSRDLLGTIGHHDKKVDDADIAAGIVSHIVTKLEIHEDANGTPFLYGELEILDTPAGRNLKALYEGGANLYVSSRGAGKLLPVANESYKLVDKNSYFCETFDVVRRPGFLKAKPMFEQVTESMVTAASSVTEIDKDKKREEQNPSKKGKVDTSFEEILQKKMNSNESVEDLKSQIDKLTKIIEKVVDDVYKVDEVVSEPKTTPEAQAGLISALALLSEANLPESELSEILDLIKGGLQ